MHSPVFNENDLKIFFGQDQEPSGSSSVDVPNNKPVEVEFQLENQNKIPPNPPTPPPGALPRVQNSFVGQYEMSTPSLIQIILKFVGIFVLIFVISFTLINGSALTKKIRYFFSTEFRNQSWTATESVPTPVASESRIIIPKIRVDAPITWNVAEEDVTQTLENGVAHYIGTALPGQVGNVFITGHSSYYIWANGNYKDVFALLDKLEAGDQIYIQYKGANFIYQVKDRQVVTPDNLTVLNQTNDKTLSLMTCVPVGTNLRRLVITAKQVAN